MFKWDEDLLFGMDAFCEVSTSIRNIVLFGYCIKVISFHHIFSRAIFEHIQSAVHFMFLILSAQAMLMASVLDLELIYKTTPLFMSQNLI